MKEFRHGQKVTIKRNDVIHNAIYLGTSAFKQNHCIEWFKSEVMTSVGYVDDCDIETAKEPKLVPWGPGDITPCMRLRKKDWIDGAWTSPLSARSQYIEFRNFVIFYDQLLQEWETFDGKPCGKEVME